MIGAGYPVERSTCGSFHGAKIAGASTVASSRTYRRT